MTNEPNFWSDADVVSVYTRAQAVEDGELVDVTAQAFEQGIRLSVCLTRGAWENLVEWSEADSKRQTYQDVSGRLWDVLTMARGCFLGSIRKAKRETGQDVFPEVGSLYLFQVLRVPRGGRGTRPRLADVVLGWTTNDDGSPALTIMLPGEG